MDLEISSLDPGDAASLSELLCSDPPDYSQYFVPFESSDSECLFRILSEAEHDRYWGIHADSFLGGMFMLRGFDEGYERPSYGVYIGKQFTNNGLSKLAICYALSWCRLNNVGAVMLKTHPENEYARRVYESAGFQFLEMCPRTGHRVYELRWS
jgi:RimJ/RimL family protein N-acetyltransferase